MGALIIGLQGPELSPQEGVCLQHPQVAGVVLFTRNYRDPAQLRALCAELHATRTGLLVMVDQEGGAVQRFCTGFTRLPPAAAFGACYDRDPAGALQRTTEAAALMAWELGQVGIDLSLAPVLDLAGPGRAIGTRAFHADPQAAAKLGVAWMHGARRMGMASVGKHYPGLGTAVGDTHRQSCVEPRTLGQLLHSDLIPFQAAMAAGIEGLMVSHVRYTAVTPEPAGFSRDWLQRQLRRQQGYRGLLLSDDLDMAAAVDFLPDAAARVRAAWEAGCDLALVCNPGAALPGLLETLAATPSTPSCEALRRRGDPPAPDVEAIRARLLRL